MSTFKDAIKKDIKAVFLNGLEFADQYNINGIDMLAVVDEVTLKERKSRGQAEYAEGVYKDQKLIFVEKSVYGEPPAIGEILRLNGSRYFVTNCIDDLGLLEISVEANAQ